MPEVGYTYVPPSQRRWEDPSHPDDEGQPTFDYTFAVWPHHEHHDKAMFDLFRLYGFAFGEGWTHRRYCEFREALARNGLTLREVSRVPHVDPETIL